MPAMGGFFAIGNINKIKDFFVFLIDGENNNLYVGEYQAYIKPESAWEDIPVGQEG